MAQSQSAPWFVREAGRHARARIESHVRAERRRGVQTEAAEHVGVGQRVDRRFRKPVLYPAELRGRLRSVGMRRGDCPATITLILFWWPRPGAVLAFSGLSGFNCS